MVLQQPARSMPIPPLESGDRLTRAEFELRYEATPEQFKAELIEGVVYVASPVRVFHGTPHVTQFSQGNEMGKSAIALHTVALIPRGGLDLPTPT